MRKTFNWKNTLILSLAAMALMSLSACTGSKTAAETGSSTAAETGTKTDGIPDTATEATEAALSGYTQDDAALAFDNAKWNYDEANNVFWQTGVGYCTKPEAEEYETMGIFVPGAYLDGTKNEDGTYTCTVNTEKEVGGYTSGTAPVVFPVNTAGYSAQEAPSSYRYEGLSDYLEAGFIYVYAGMRGRENGYDEAGQLTYSGGAPWGVTDLKAAVRYYRYNENLLPGNAERIFTFGHSGGGAQSAVMGASGDSALYFDYLKSIGAAMADSEGNYISDAIMGAQSWCPITSLDYADEAYEWNMGQFSSDGTRADDTWTSALSDDLSEAYADYINELGLKDEAGNLLTLETSENGIYQAGSYYDYLLEQVETSLNNFLSDTDFPYTQTAGTMNADGGFAGGGKQTADKADGQGRRPSGEKNETGKSDRPEMPEQNAENTEITYATVQDYIDDLNSDETWITYDAGTNTAQITSLEAFVKHEKKATKNVGAFDDLDRGQAENKVFGNDDSNALHFDPVMAELLQKNEETYSSYEDWDSSLTKSYQDDLAETDKLGKTIEERMDMYNPMYYISDYYDGIGTSVPASYWRIHTGIKQGDTALTVETNLSLALSRNEAVKKVDFQMVWDQGHTMAERTGTSTGNFISWVKECINSEN